MNLDEMFLKRNDLIKQKVDIERQISELNSEMMINYAPVKPGSIIDNGIVRIRVGYISYNGEFWVAVGPALTKKNKISGRHTTHHSINIVDLDGARNTVKVIEKL